MSCLSCWPATVSANLPRRCRDARPKGRVRRNRARRINMGARLVSGGGVARVGRGRRRARRSEGHGARAASSPLFASLLTTTTKTSQPGMSTTPEDKPTPGSPTPTSVERGEATKTTTTPARTTPPPGEQLELADYGIDASAGPPEQLDHKGRRPLRLGTREETVALLAMYCSMCASSRLRLEGRPLMVGLTRCSLASRTPAASPRRLERTPLHRTPERLERTPLTSPIRSLHAGRNHWAATPAHAVALPGQHASAAARIPRLRVGTLLTPCGRPRQVSYTIVSLVRSLPPPALAWSLL